MPLTRRDVLLGAGGLAVSCAALRPERRARAAPLRVVACDAFVLFDPRPFARRLEATFPGRGAALAAAYRARLFDYGWLRALGDRYQDFWRLSEAALDAVDEAEGLRLTAPARAALLEAWGTLPPWPDAAAGVRGLSRRGLDVALLSNWSPRMLRDALARSGLEDVVRPLSTDAARTYKPDPRAYAIALDAFGRTREEVLFVAFAAWDAAGASWFGYPTVWMNRAGAPRERLDMERVRTATSFDDLTV